MPNRVMTQRTSFPLVQRQGSIRNLCGLAAALCCTAIGTHAQTPEPPKEGGAGKPGTESPAPADFNLEEYRIDVGDTLEVAILFHPELSKVVTVAPDGRVSYLYLGPINIAGLSLTDFAAKIEKGLAKEVESPKANVTLLKRGDRTVNIVGAGVHGAGKRPLVGDSRILDLLSEAGGLVGKADEVNANLFRRNKVISIDLAALLAGDTSQNIRLEPGDTLVVEPRDLTRTQINVQGAVAKTGWVPLPPDHTLMSVLTVVGGTTPAAALSHVSIKRGGKVIPIDLSKKDTDVEAATFLVEPGDLIFVPMNQRMYGVFGAVGAPRLYGYPDNEPLNLIRAIANAGGVQAGADLKKATLLRGAANPDRLEDDGKKRAVSRTHVLTTSALLDTVQTMTGTAAFYPFNRSVTAEGLLPASAATTAEPVSPTSKASAPVSEALLNGYMQYFAIAKEEVIPINLEDILKKGDLTKDVAMRPGDIVFVPSKEPGRRGFQLTDVLPWVGLIRYFPF